MAKTTHESFYDRLTTKATMVARDARPLTYVDIPQNIRDQVQEAHDNDLAILLDVTTEEEFTLVRGVYIAAIAAIPGCSAYVTRQHTVTKDAAGEEIGREWTATRVVVGSRRGRNPTTNGEVPESTDTTTERADGTSW